MYGKILNYNGYDVTCVDTGEEGVRVARTEQPNLILLDLGLPDVDGVEVLRMLRQAGLSSVPVVALTARSASHSTVTAEAAFREVPGEAGLTTGG